uniref:Uncharacterized protein n=1 Tax=Tetradesmus obliquus TaxID=3088 RepID=A0A383VG98_TETOB|eukprot:jgi/Sobl393_1/19888/SZX64585.1
MAHDSSKRAGEPAEDEDPSIANMLHSIRMEHCEWMSKLEEMVLQTQQQQQQLYSNMLTGLVAALGGVRSQVPDCNDTISVALAEIERLGEFAELRDDLLEYHDETFVEFSSSTSGAACSSMRQVGEALLMDAGQLLEEAGCVCKVLGDSCMQIGLDTDHLVAALPGVVFAEGLFDRLQQIRHWFDCSFWQNRTEGELLAQCQVQNRSSFKLAADTQEWSVPRLLRLGRDAAAVGVG